MLYSFSERSEEKRKPIKTALSLYNKVFRVFELHLFLGHFRGGGWGTGLGNVVVENNKCT